MISQCLGKYWDVMWFVSWKADCGLYIFFIICTDPIFVYDLHADVSLQWGNILYSWMSWKYHLQMEIIRRSWLIKYGIISINC
jgi:hypothetical protein